MFVVIAILLAIFVLPTPWGWIAIVVGVVAEIGETIVWMRLLRRHPASSGSDALIGALARVVTPLRPIGEVRARGEVWRARCASGADAGDAVRVIGRDGITLVVDHISRPDA